jgi:hypothetical protein
VDAAFVCLIASVDSRVFCGETESDFCRSLDAGAEEGEDEATAESARARAPTVVLVPVSRLVERYRMSETFTPLPPPPPPPPPPPLLRLASGLKPWVRFNAAAEPENEADTCPAAIPEPPSMPAEGACGEVLPFSRFEMGVLDL